MFHPRFQYFFFRFLISYFCLFADLIRNKKLKVKYNFLYCCSNAFCENFVSSYGNGVQWKFKFKTSIRFFKQNSDRDVESTSSLWIQKNLRKLLLKQETFLFIKKSILFSYKKTKCSQEEKKKNVSARSACND